MLTFDIERLEPMDIILVRFSDDPQSMDIRKACNSEFSHAIIYLGNGSFVEGFAPMVTLFSFNRYFFSKPEDIRVLRLKNKEHFDQPKAEKTLRSLSFCNYSDRLLVNLKRRNLDSSIIKRFESTGKWTGGVVCTSLISLPYFSGGIDFSSTGEPYYADFGHIENYEGLEEITGSILVDSEALPDFAVDYFEASQTGSILEKQSEIVKELNAYVTDVYRKIRNRDMEYDIPYNAEEQAFTSWEDIFPVIMRWFLNPSGRKIDEELSTLLTSTGYLSLWYEEVHNNKQLFFPVYNAMTGGSIPARADLEFIKNSLELALNHYNDNEDAIFGNFINCPARTFHLLFDMYRSYTDLLRATIGQYGAMLGNYDDMIKG
jgi:hypothetical protein